MKLKCCRNRILKAQGDRDRPPEQKMAELAAPLRVSPFIRFSRWSFLLGGVLYGLVRHSSLSKKEAAIREVEEKQKAIRDAKLAEEKKRLAKVELDELAKLAGATPEP